MNVNAILINYFPICHRKLWPHANGITMEHISDIAYEGNIIGEENYGVSPKFRENSLNESFNKLIINLL